MNKTYKFLVAAFWPWWNFRPRKRVKPPEHFNCKCAIVIIPTTDQLAKLNDIKAEQHYDWEE